MSDINLAEEIRQAIRDWETDQEESRVTASKLGNPVDISYFQGYIDGLESALDDLYAILDALEETTP